MVDRILILASARWLRRESLAALQGLGAELVAVGEWVELERELRRRGALLVLLLSPLRGAALMRRVVAMRALAPRLQLFVLWWDESEQGAMERLMCGVNQIYTLPCSVERLRYRVAQLLQRNRGSA